MIIYGNLWTTGRQRYLRKDTTKYSVITDFGNPMIDLYVAVKERIMSTSFEL